MMNGINPLSNNQYSIAGSFGSFGYTDGSSPSGARSPYMQDGASSSGDPARPGEKADPVSEAQEKTKGCHTCENRRYQDGSNDPGVSFKAPTKIDPKNAAAAVAGHEKEHVFREQAKAQRENKKVVSQSVSYSTDICPECHQVYVSGGVTRTTTKTQPESLTAADIAAQADGIGLQYNALV